MGAGSSALAQTIKDASPEELAATLKSLSAEDQKKIVDALAAKSAVPAPADVVVSTMKKFEDHYNADETAKSAGFYAAACDVTVNDGTVFAGKTPEEVAGFLGQLRNGLGGTNMKFAVTKLDGNVHDDVWVADNGAGSCHAVWEQAGGEWRITKDAIKFTPKASGENAGGVPVDTVMSTMKKFEDAYNADDTVKCATYYAEECDVSVNGGDVFAGKTSEEVAGFLNALRNTMGGTNMKFAITKVEGSVHEDVWVADNGAGSCTATWAEVKGEWKIVKDEIKFTSKVG